MNVAGVVSPPTTSDAAWDAYNAVRSGAQLAAVFELSSDGTSIDVKDVVDNTDGAWVSRSHHSRMHTLAVWCGAHTHTHTHTHIHTLTHSLTHSLAHNMNTYPHAHIQV